MKAEDVERIHEASLRILDEVGVRLEHDEVVARLLAAGARPGHGPHDVRLPPAMVRERLALAPRNVELAARDGGAHPQARPQGAGGLPRLRAAVPRG